MKRTRGEHEETAPDVDDLVKSDFLLMLNERVGALETLVQELSAQLLEDVIEVICSYSSTPCSSRADPEWFQDDLRIITTAIKDAVRLDGRVRVINATASPSSCRMCSVLIELARPYPSPALSRWHEALQVALPQGWKAGVVYRPVSRDLWMHRVSGKKLHALEV